MSKKEELYTGEMVMILLENHLVELKGELFDELDGFTNFEEVEELIYRFSEVREFVKSFAQYHNWPH